MTINYAYLPTRCLFFGALGTKFGQFTDFGIDEIYGEILPITRKSYCQNKLCGVRNTSIMEKYCSIMCADRDAGVISEQEWVEMHYRYWQNSDVSHEMLGV